MFNYAVKDSKQMFGTELMGEEFKKRVLPHAPSLAEYNWGIMPGSTNYSDKYSLVWLHLEHNNSSVLNNIHYIDQLVDHFVLVSHWQYHQFLEKNLLSPYKCSVIKNAIDPIEPHIKPPTDVVNLVYTSNPVRGLEVLLESLKYLEDENIRLHVFRDVAGIKIPKDPRIILRGKVSNEELREALKEMHIFSYPCNFYEVSCIALMEAMSAGCYCVHSDVGALPETSMGLTQMYEYLPHPELHAKRFAQELTKAIDTVRSGWDATSQIQAANNAYNWESRVKDWVEFSEKIRPHAVAKVPLV